MKTTFDIENILYQYLKASALATEITGGIYKRQKPVNSANEDIVINCLPVNNLQLQRAVANVNIHVPNKPVFVNGVNDTSHPDHSRLQELAGIAEPILQDHSVGQDYGFSIQQQQLIQDEGSDFHYINFRIDFYSLNV
jgi:hypothetical protein